MAALLLLAFIPARRLAVTGGGQATWCVTQSMDVSRIWYCCQKTYSRQVGISVTPLSRSQPSPATDRKGFPPAVSAAYTPSYCFITHHQQVVELHPYRSITEATYLTPRSVMRRMNEKCTAPTRQAVAKRSERIPPHLYRPSMPRCLVLISPQAAGGRPSNRGD